MAEHSASEHSIKLANPSAIGLFGLAMVTLVASSQKLGITEGTSFVIPWAIFLGALAQLYAGMIDVKLNNTFGATAFCAYGFFWLAVGMTWMIQHGIFGAEMAQRADINQLGIAFIGYLIFTLFMTIGAMAVSKVLFMIFVLINFLFIGLALSTFGIAIEIAVPLAGISELLISILSFYGAASTVLNIQFKKSLIPMGRPFKIFTK